MRERRWCTITGIQGITCFYFTQQIYTRPYREPTRQAQDVQETLMKGGHLQWSSQIIAGLQSLDRSLKF